MSAKHTPGPWVPLSTEGHTNIVAVKPVTACVFSLPGHDKSDPDVRLISAAPELLDALKWFIDGIDGTHTSMVGFDTNVAKARRAIAKAAA